jgi:L-iditol 2-dehydrogenase
MADRVCVLGAGAIGIALVAVSKKIGARDIFVTAKHPIQIEIIKKLGVKEENIINPDDIDASQKILEKTDNLGVDCVLESVGISGSIIEFGISILRNGGRLVFTGLFEEKVNLSFWDVLVKDASIIASGAYGMWDLVHEFTIAAEMLARGEFPAKDIVTHKFSIDKINEAFQQKIKPNERNKTIKVEIVY